jgi:hypothetical protein
LEGAEEIYSSCELLRQRKVKQTRHNCDWYNHKKKKERERERKRERERERELCRNVQIRASKACYRKCEVGISFVCKPGR